MLLSIELSRLRIESFFAFPFRFYHIMGSWVGIRVMVREWFPIFFASLRGQFCPAVVVESFLARRISFNSYVTIRSEVALFLMSECVILSIKVFLCL